MTLSISIAAPSGKYNDPSAKDTPESEWVITLEEAINLALQANRSLASEGNSLKSTELALLATESEFEFKIKPGAQAGINYEEKKAGLGFTLAKKFPLGMTVSTIPNFVWSDRENVGQVGVALTLPLFRGFGKKSNLDGIESAKHTLRKSNRSFYNSQVGLVLETVRAMYDIIKQEEFADLSRSQIGNLTYHAESARVKEKVGLASPLDVYRAEIRLKDLQQTLNRAHEALTNAKDRLKILLALPVENALKVSAPLEVNAISIDDQTAIKTALENRIELRQSKDDIDESVRKSALAKHNTLPQLNLVMDYGRFSRSEVFSDAMRLEDDRWSVTLDSNTDWFRTNEKLAFRQSLISVKQARLNYKIKVAEIKREVRRQLEEIRAAWQRIEIRKEQIWQAKGKLELSKIKFAHAMANNFDLIEAETELQRAFSDLISAKINYITGTYQLRAVLGTLVAQ